MGPAVTQTPYWLYIVLCADATLYTGIATDVARRVCEHNGAATAKTTAKGKGARYTSARRPV
ncbi:MAG: GIY-YIG nuclease family protein, partial [Hyphomicrobium sp.]